MQTLRFTIFPRTAFGTPLAGDTLFGQLCWALRHCFGNEWLTERLADYTEGKPFLVVSDAFPQGFLPLPSVPNDYWKVSDSDRKTLKKKRWLPMEKLASNFCQWQSLARNDAEAVNNIIGASQPLAAPRTQPHNSINRVTGTTDEKFTPYGMAQYWFHPDMRLDLYAVIDESRILADDLIAALDYMGRSGYGRDASIGLGKFVIKPDTAFTGPAHAKDANAFLTLAPCAPQGQGFVRERSFYQILTRFGRHGDIAVQSGNPFKRPLLLAKTGSVFASRDGNHQAACIGQGLRGISTSQTEAVAQGYAPVIGICMEKAQ
jgi:CRISPR-associated protein Csm4